MQNVNVNVAWIVVAGLGGYLVGNALPIHGQWFGPKTSSSIAATDEETVPPNWLKESDIGATALFAGLTPSQRYRALKVLNTKPCDCGCPHGSIAQCKKEDPDCTVAPKEIEIAVQEARAGKTVEQIYAVVRHPAVMQAMPGMNMQSSQPAGSAQPNGPIPVLPTHHVPLATWTPTRGAKNAKVTIVEFSDFQCPYCQKVEPVIKQIMDDYGKDVRLAWRHNPLPFHEHAPEAAEASMAAADQGKFWEMHDKLFANQSALDRPSLDRYAQEIGLDMGKFKATMDSHQNLEKIQTDTKAAADFEVNGTPGFFVNGQYMFGSVPYGNFKMLIDAELIKANALLKAGTKYDKLYEAELNALPPESAPSSSP
jgi:protein-disulfide isomerase